MTKVLKMMVGNNLTDVQLQQLVDRTIVRADDDFDGRISFLEFKKVVFRLCWLGISPNLLDG